MGNKTFIVVRHGLGGKSLMAYASTRENGLARVEILRAADSAMAKYRNAIAEAAAAFDAANPRPEILDVPSEVACPPPSWAGGMTARADWLAAFRAYSLRRAAAEAKYGKAKSTAAKSAEEDAMATLDACGIDAFNLQFGCPDMPEYEVEEVDGIQAFRMAETYGDVGRILA